MPKGRWEPLSHGWAKRWARVGHRCCGYRSQCRACRAGSEVLLRQWLSVRERDDLYTNCIVLIRRVRPFAHAAWRRNSGIRSHTWAFRLTAIRGSKPKAWGVARNILLGTDNWDGLNCWHAGTTAILHLYNSRARCHNSSPLHAQRCQRMPWADCLYQDSSLSAWVTGIQAWSIFLCALPIHGLSSPFRYETERPQHCPSPDAIGLRRQCSLSLEPCRQRFLSLLFRSPRWTIRNSSLKSLHIVYREWPRTFRERPFLYHTRSDHLRPFDAILVHHWRAGLSPSCRWRLHRPICYQQTCLQCGISLVPVPPKRRVRAGWWWWFSFSYCYFFSNSFNSSSSTWLCGNSRKRPCRSIRI